MNWRVRKYWNNVRRKYYCYGRSSVSHAEGSSVRWIKQPVIRLFLVLLFLFAGSGFAGAGKDKLSYGEGLIVNIPLPESEVSQVVEDIAQNGIIRGTKEYNKDEFVTGAKAEKSSRVFPPWNEGGKVFYKVREQAIDPRNFKDGSDVGTLAVRYVVQPQGEKNTVLRIDALFVEDFRKVVHKSNGSVESNEYKDIEEHLEGMELLKKETAEAEREQRDQINRKSKPSVQSDSAGATEPSVPQADSQMALPPQQSEAEPAATSSSEAAPKPAAPAQEVEGQRLEDHVKDLRKQVQRLVRAPGAPLKSAPFHTASTLQTLPAGTEVLILISTPYWYGIETHDGQHGWMQREQLEQP